MPRGRWPQAALCAEDGQRGQHRAGEGAAAGNLRLIDSATIAAERQEPVGAKRGCAYQGSGSSFFGSLRGPLVGFPRSQGDQALPSAHCSPAHATKRGLPIGGTVLRKQQRSRPLILLQIVHRKCRKNMSKCRWRTGGSHGAHQQPNQWRRSRDCLAAFV